MNVKNNGIFLRVLSLFLAVIISVSIAFIAIVAEDKTDAQEAVLDKIRIGFEHNSSEAIRMISHIRYSMEELSVKFAADKDFENGSYIEKNNLRADMRAVLIDNPQNEFSKYIATAFLVDARKEGYIYELTGTHTSSVFYERFFKNEQYDDAFWLSRTGGGSLFELLPAETYSVLFGSLKEEMQILPVCYKPKQESGYVIVVLLDIGAFARDFDISALRVESTVLFASEKALKIDELSQVLDTMKVRNGTVICCSDKNNGKIELFKIVPDADVVNETDKMGVWTLLFALLFFVFAIILSLLFAFRYSRFVKDVSDELLKNSEVKKAYDKETLSIREMASAVKLTASHVGKTDDVQHHGESILDAMLLQAHMRDVYVGVEDIESKINYSETSFMAYFKVSYRKEFLEFMSEDTGKATFLLKQLIEGHLEKLGVSAIAFQIERNGIAVVFSSYEKYDDIKKVIDDVLLRLENESEYAYFTISVSRKYDESLKIKEVYETLSDLSKYGKLTDETQVLFEEDMEREASRFYFSVEDMGKLSAVLQNGTEDEVLRKVDEIIEYNVRKNINRFEMYLLCTEIINCAVKLVNRVFYTLPKNIDIAAVYRSLESADASYEYRSVCADFLHEMIEYIKENKREDDYIISYILDYVENHYAEDIYLNLFAEKLKLTGAYISSYFKEKMNVNLTDYINNYRIKKAVILSENPQNKNKDIAEMVGLPNINTFIRLFKKYTGYTPGEYRKKHFGEDVKE